MPIISNLCSSQQTFIFTLPDVEVIEKFWMVDADGFFADIGGFLGLLLGTSCLHMVERILEICNKICSRQRK